MFAAVIGIILIIQAIIGLVLVAVRTYSDKHPAKFVGFASIILIAGVLSVLSEASHLEPQDLVFCYSILLIPGAITIIPPLVQNGLSQSKSTSDDSSDA